MLMYEALRRRFGGREELGAAVGAEILSAATAIDADLILIDGVPDSWLQISCTLRGRRRVARLYTQLPYKPLPAEIAGVDCGPRIYLCPRELELPEYACTDALYTEPSLYFGPYPKPALSDSTALQPKMPIVYCTLGSQIAFYTDPSLFFRHALAAAAALPQFQFMINAGPMASALVAPKGAGNVQIVPFIPHREILPKAVVAISHGGFGVIKEW